MLGFVIHVSAFVLGIVGIVSLKRGAVFLPMEKPAVKYLLEAVQFTPGDVAVDLGSGDGRIVIALARAGAVAHGFEHNPILVWWSRRRIKKAGLIGKAFIHNTNFWDEDFSHYSVIVIFGINYVMGKLEKKFDEGLKPGTRVVSYLFPLPTWKSESTRKGLFVYRVK